jgi:hypothetical protein
MKRAILSLAVVVTSLIAGAPQSNAQQSTRGGAFKWPYHTDLRQYNLYTVVPGYEAGFRDTDGNIWTPKQRDGQITASPYQGQVAWREDGSHAYEWVWKVHYPTVESKKVWICKTSLGTPCVSYVEPHNLSTSSTEWHEAIASMEDGISMRKLRWIGEEPEWAAELLSSILQKDSRPALPHWAYNNRIGWRSGRGYSHPEAIPARGESEDHYGDTGTGVVNRYTRQAGSPKDGYIAKDNSRWTPLVPNGSATYGNLSQSRSAQHRVPYMWKIQGVGRPESQLVTVYKTSNGSFSVTYNKATTEHGGYPATATVIRGDIHSIRFHGGEPWSGAARQISDMF